MVRATTGWRRAALGLFGTVWGAAAACGAAQAQMQPQAPAWEPRQTIQLIVPAGRGGGADQMARLIRDIAAKHGLTAQPIQVLNRPGHGGFTELKAARGDPHALLVSLSSVFTAPLLEGAEFSWRDFTPVSMLALDEFVLWVGAEAPYRTVPDFLAAARRTDPAKRFRMGGTGARQEDWIITQAIQGASGAEFAYTAHRAGGEVASQLANGQLEATVNNPIEALPAWRAGSVRPLCVFDDQRLTSTERPTPAMGWSDIPTCKESGLPVEYQMMRSVFMAPGVEPAQVAYYADLLRRVQDTAEWKDYMREGAFNTTTATGAELRRRLASEEEHHRDIVRGGLSIGSLQQLAAPDLATATGGNEN